MHIARDFKSIFSVKKQSVKNKESKTRNLNDFQRVLKMPKLHCSGPKQNGYYTGSSKEVADIENEQRRERYRQILERRKAKSANDQETVQSATKDNTNAISNDATKAKQIRRL